MVPIEIVSHFARPLSLTIRLFANMLAGEKVTLVFLGLTYFLVPAVFMGLHVFVSFLQAFVFMVLTMIYIGGAVRTKNTSSALCRWQCEPPASQRTVWNHLLSAILLGENTMKSKMFLLLLALFVLATPVFAQDAPVPAPDPAITITSGIAMALASGLCALASGPCTRFSAEAIARNPGAGNAIRGALMLGLVLIESLALFTLRHHLREILSVS